MAKLPQGARLKQSAAPQAVKAAAQVLGLPQRVGTVVPTTYMTEDELAQIRKIVPNFKKGDPLPADFADKVDDQLQTVRERVVQQARYEAQTMLPVHPSTPALAEPKEVSIEDLAEDQRQELRNYIITSQEKFKNRSQVAKATAHLDPSVATAYAQALQEEAGTPPTAESALDLAKLRAIQAGAYAKPEPAATTPPPASQPQPAPKRQESQPAPEIPPATHYCPQCGWDVTDKDVVEIDENDKLRYVLAVAAGKRFVKSYEIFGGKISVTFRTLLTKEERLVLSQINRDMITILPVVNELHLAQMTTRMTDYRMAMAIEAFSNSSGITECPEYAQLDFGKSEDSVRELHEMIVEGLLATDIVTDAVRRAYGKFAAIQRWMLDNAGNPDFF